VKVILAALLLLLLLCTARFGRAGLARLAALRLRGGPLAGGACLLQLAGALAQQHRLALLLLSAALLAGFCWLNRRQAGAILITTGVALNMAVMAVNDGYMPISPGTLVRQTGLHVPAGTALPATKDMVLDDHVAGLALLGDRLLLPGPLAPLAAWSIGDFLLIAGVGRLLWQTMKGFDDARRSFWNSAAVP
jgi:hypothetical protein